MIVLVAFSLVAFVRLLILPFSSSSSSSCCDNLGLLWRLDHFVERTSTLERLSALRFWPSFQPHVLLRYLSLGRILDILYYFFFLSIRLLRLVGLGSGDWIVSVQSSLSTNGTRSTSTHPEFDIYTTFTREKVTRKVQDFGSERIEALRH